MKKIFCLAVVLFLSVTAFAFDQNGNFADFKGNKVYFKSFGKGKKAIVFVHGWTCNSEFWKDSYVAFPKYRTLAIDLPGHGQSDKPKTDYTMNFFAKSIAAVMEKANVQQAVLVGHSMGTPVIRQFYRLYPEKTLGLVIVDGALRPYLEEEIFEEFFAPVRANYKENAPNFIDGMLMSVKDEKLKQRIREAMLATPDYVALSAMDAMGDEKIWEKDQIKVPVLAIMAPSPAWKDDEKEFFQSIAPNLDFRMWQGYSHFLMMEEPALFNKTVKLFITKNKLL
jgi:Predicted hydrolases or acyltransferases (alpha/beta hydrolase superfamily)